MSRFFLRPGESLNHGAEVVASCFQMREDELRQQVYGRENERKFYTVDLIRGVLEEVVLNDQACGKRLVDAFSRMMAVDSLLGLNDRHPQNWGVIFHTIKTSVPPRFAPLFDSARGLFWNVPDNRFKEWERSGTRKKNIESYSRRSTPLIGIDGQSDPNHFDVIDYMVNLAPGDHFARSVRSVIQAFPIKTIRDLLDSVASDYFSPLRLGYIAELLELRYHTLSKICKINIV